MFVVEFVAFFLLFWITPIHSSVFRSTVRDSSSLRFVQMIHTHGDRTPSQFVANDPFNAVEIFWPEGVGQLTEKGKERMLKIGEFFKPIYQDFVARNLNKTNLEQFVRIRSSAYRRCLQSAALFSTGLFGGGRQQPINNTYQSKFIDEYNFLMKIWTPVPIISYRPKAMDPILDADFDCPNVQKGFLQIRQQDLRVRDSLRKYRQFFDEISFFTGEHIDSLEKMNNLYKELYIEQQHNYHWWQWPYEIWSKNFDRLAIEQSREISKLYWSYYYDSSLIQRLIGGELIKKINKNFRRFLNESDENHHHRERFTIFSTHDGKIVVLLKALGIDIDDYLVDPGTVFIIELHQNASSYYLKFFLYNESITKESIRKYLLQEIFPKKFCLQQQQQQQRSKSLWTSESSSSSSTFCSIEEFLEYSQQFEPIDIEYECGLKHSKLTEKVNRMLWISNAFLATCLIALLGYVLIVNKFTRHHIKLL
ncbi:lysosomal acid phosphatase-like protein 2 [Sarcoptes scabiei]|uniref:Lysosomal acid phosphatase-like protein 2 n=2 Tax=Sarcoptes scabiei TaxID=52283 RepID=A0A132AG01_SARSC|nr:lysosomal acid phosphatase-like protein 2 [Sarcoptes scabiei]